LMLGGLLVPDFGSEYKEDCIQDGVCEDPRQEGRLSGKLRRFSVGVIGVNWSGRLFGRWRLAFRICLLQIHRLRDQQVRDLRAHGRRIFGGCVVLQGSQ
jgi:hypothetical protein